VAAAQYKMAKAEDIGLGQNIRAAYRPKANTQGAPGAP